MPSTSLPSGLSWLSPAYRPTRDEIETYAELIAANEGMPPDHVGDLKREAELQLWVWRTETHQRPPRRPSRKAA